MRTQEGIMENVWYCGSDEQDTYMLYQGYILAEVLRDILVTNRNCHVSWLSYCMRFVDGNDLGFFLADNAQLHWDRTSNQRRVIHTSDHYS